MSIFKQRTLLNTNQFKTKRQGSKTTMALLKKRLEQLPPTKNLLSYKKQSTLESYLLGQKAIKVQNRYLNLFHHSLLEFWSGDWNEGLLINPIALKTLKNFIDEQLKQNIRFFNALLSANQSDIEQNPDTKDHIGLTTLTQTSAVALMYNAWLHVCAGVDHRVAPFEENLEFTDKSNFYKSRLDVSAFTNEIFNQQINAPHILPNKSLEEQNALRNKIQDQLKAEFCTALGSTLVKFALDHYKLSYQEAEEFITAANLLINFGNVQGIWDLCLINTLVIPFQETNPFANENEWQRALRTEKALLHIDKSYKTWKDDLHFIEVMVNVSLMRDSLVLNEATFIRVLEHLNTPELLERLGEQIIVRIELPNQFAQEVLISPLTEFYLRQYYRLCSQQKRPYHLKMVFSSDVFYKKLGISKNTLKLEGFKSWKHSIKNYLLLQGHFFGLIGALAFKDLKSHPLINSARQRVLRLKLHVQDEAELSGFSEQNLAGHKRRPRSVIWQKLRNYLNVHHIPAEREYAIRKGIQLKITRLIQNPQATPTEKLIAQYAKEKVDKTVYGHALSPSQTLVHIDAFGLALIIELGTSDLSNTNSETRQAFYLQALEQEDIKKERFLYYLKFFEDWFVNVKKASPIPDYEELFGDVKRPAFKVDANILTFEEYNEALNLMIKSYEKETETRFAIPYRQSAILLILGFRLDLRRGESLHLLSKNWVFDPEQPNLFIKPHKDRKLKTVNAERLFHIEEHLDPSEQHFIEQYLQDMQIKYEGAARYFFVDEFAKPQAPERLTKPLMHILHAVTNDKNFKYHNLRHSKATWEMLAILNAQFDLHIEELYFSHLPQTAAFLKSAKTRWEKMVHTPESLHKAPHLLKKVMGHGSISTTLLNYIHLTDIVIGAIQMKIAQQTMTTAWGIENSVANKNTLYKRLKKTGLPPHRILLESVMPWPESKTNKPELPSVSKKNQHLNQVSQTNQKSLIEFSSLTPLEELRKLKPFRLFELSFEDLNPEEKQHALSLLDFKPERIDEHFKQYPKYRLKPLLHKNQQMRLLNGIQKLPKHWLEGIINGHFFDSDTFEHPRHLITHFVGRITTKLEKTTSTILPRVKEFDLICHHFNEAPDILKLCAKLNIPLSFKFQPPKSNHVTIEDWRNKLGLTKKMLNDQCVLSSRVLNPNGRLIIKLENSNKTRSKASENYFLLMMIDSYMRFRNQPL
ncbi:hypothetical protein [Thiomicrospira sp.]|uniref:hypothetical protein n=1 Tax=Thiomicrospira sp. TaxID=935 RepID=UPI002F926B92